MSRTRPAWVRRTAVCAALVLGMAWALDRAFPLPLPAAAPERAAPSAVNGALVVLAADGTPLRTWPSADGALRQPVALDAVSPLYFEALLRYEDRWFRWHPGVNPAALARAGWQWLAHGRIVSGGSTLTMQVARLLDPPEASGLAPRSTRAKLRQIARALQLEWHCSKREILALYLNHAPMGGQLEGVEAASRAYLGKGARELSHAEAALLVALPQRPSRLRPDRDPALAQAARDKVLQRMADTGTWPQAAVDDAKLERVFAPPLRARWLAPLAAERLRQEALRGVKARKADDPSAIVPPTLPSLLDPAVQLQLERVLLDRLSSLPEHASIAALVVENDTLAVRGYAGSADLHDARRASHVDMVRGVRSPGSTLKPFLYAMALDEGLVHSESLLIDAPQDFGGYAPGNFQAAFMGPVSVSEALQRSLNVPAVDLLERLGPARFAAKLRHAGVRLRVPAAAAPNLSLILGGGGTTLEELVGAYTALARGGLAAHPRLRPDDPLVETRLMSPGAAFIVREILENGGRPGTPFREGDQRIAWKTGTSFGFRDAWAVGVTDRYSVGVWVGRPDGTPNPGHFGANTAAPLVKDLLQGLGPTATKPRNVPASVQAVAVCWPLGLAAAATPPGHCREQRMAWTLDGAAPPTLPDRVRPEGYLSVAWQDAAGTQRLRPDCAPPGAALQRVEYVRWPALLGPWVSEGQRSAVERLPWHAGCAAQRTEQSLRITGLEAGTVLRAPPGQQAVTLQVQAVGTREPVQWLLDGRLVAGREATGAALRVQLDRPGTHALTALDSQGRYGRVNFAVR